MAVLDDYIKQTSAYGTQYNTTDTGQVTIKATIPPIYQNKINSIVNIMGYINTQEYITALFKEVPEVETVIIPYEILKLIDEDYNNICGGG